ncbi:MAG TPA: methylated-DNA--[protein]-cysteine S-methyltransferase [Gammaproteobacteria bacterium]
MEAEYWDSIDTIVGTVAFCVDERGRVTALRFSAPDSEALLSPRRCEAVRRQLEEYFAGERTAFELELAPAGTAFQQSVWQGLTEIPFGTAFSYGELAKHIGKPGAARAVGQANGRNPIPVIIPCHRVIAADRSIGGFASGLAIKRRLLALERIELAA